MVSRSIGGWVAESEVADILRDTERAYRDAEGNGADGVAIGSYPFFREGRVGANFVVRSADEGLVDRCLADLAARLTAAGHQVTDGGI